MDNFSVTSSNSNSNSHLSIIIGIFAIIVILYRITMIGYPLFLKGIRTNNITLIVQAITQLI